MSEFVPCPKCRATGAERMKFTWWGGVLGPKILSHVKCPQCGHAYNGKSGKDNTIGIIIYSAIVAVVLFGLIFVIFAAAGIFMALSNR